jgi:patched 1
LESSLIRIFYFLPFSEGGRLEEELKYTQKSLGEMDSSTHQLLIQTPNDKEATILHPQALLTHLEVVKQAISVTVHMFDITWSLKDMCYSPNIPNFDTHYIEQIFENVIPCAIITPLDCFWEGSKLLGPEFPVHIP